MKIFKVAFVFIVVNLPNFILVLVFTIIVTIDHFCFIFYYRHLYCYCLSRLRLIIIPIYFPFLHFLNCLHFRFLSHHRHRHLHRCLINFLNRRNHRIFLIKSCLVLYLLHVRHLGIHCTGVRSEWKSPAYLKRYWLFLHYCLTIGPSIAFRCF